MNTRKRSPRSICFALLLTGFAAAALLPRRSLGSTTATLLRWPYLQQVTSRSAHLLWTTDIKGVPAIEYGAGQSPLPAVGIISRVVATPGGSYYEHKAVLSGLKPNTWYYYRIFDNEVNLTPSGKRWLQTAPVNGAFTFAAFGDSGAGTPEQYQVRDQMVSQWPDINLFVHTGDLAYPEGAFAEYEEFFFDVYQELLTWRPIFPTMGNHDHYTDDGAPYLNLFDLPMQALALSDLEHYYAFDWGYAHFVVLDSHEPLWRISDESDSDMADWLEADLAQDDHAWTIAVIHRPLYSSSPTHTEIDVREKLAPIFEAYGVDLVLSGHNHNYERSHPIHNGTVSTLTAGGVVHVVTGGGGGMLYPVPGHWFTAARAETHHFVKVRVNKCTLVLTAIDKEGTVIDHAVLDKCEYQAYLPLLRSVPSPDLRQAQ